jgi:oligosaccharide translocation protein RFT1
MWVQSAIKHVLTQGDSLLIAWLTTNHDQGVYALAANYGSLIARMLFQPIEESSRNLFAKLLSHSAKDDKVPPENLASASTILKMILKFYSLLSVFFFSLAPSFAPVALSIIAGRQWANSEAGAVLAAYCYYIPLLAVNGVTEAFVQSVATKRELAQQSAWMFAFSLGFAGVGWMFLGALGWGAKGLVAANAVNMIVRIVWSGVFIAKYFRRNGGKVEWRQTLPNATLCAAAAGAAAIAKGAIGRQVGVVGMVGMGGSLGVALLGVW